MAYKKLIKVSNVCQLLDKSKYPATTTKAGITWTNNGDGTITANGTATAFTNILVDTVTPTIIKSGHKFLMLGCPLSNGNITTSKEYWMQEGYEFCSDHGVGGFFSLKGNNMNLRVYIQKDYTADNLTFKPQIFDLTEMYGAGNEPTTVAQFRQDFPNDLYDYSPRCWATSYSRRLKVSNVCQLLKPNFLGDKTIAGVTCTSNGNTFTLNGTSSGEASISEPIPYINSKGLGHRFLISGCPQGAWSSYSILYGALNQGSHALDYGNGTIFTSSTAGTYFGVAIKRAGVTFDNLTFKPQLFDLTEMYGAGHEPATVEQFRADFPNDLYDYKPYSIVPSYKRNLTCKTKNLLSFPYYGQYKTKQGITFSKVSTYKVNASGINTGSTGCTFDFNYNKVFKAGTYTIKFYTEGSVPPELYYRIRKDSYYGGTIISDKEFQKTFTLSEDTVLFIGFGIYGTGVPEYTGKKINVNVWCQIEKGDTATDYVPYGHL